MSRAASGIGLQYNLWPVSEAFLGFPRPALEAVWKLNRRAEG